MANITFLSKGILSFFLASSFVTVKNASRTGFPLNIILFDFRIFFEFSNATETILAFGAAIFDTKPGTESQS